MNGLVYLSRFSAAIVQSYPNIWEADDSSFRTLRIEDSVDLLWKSRTPSCRPYDQQPPYKFHLIWLHVHVCVHVIFVSFLSVLPLYARSCSHSLFCRVAAVFVSVHSSPSELWANWSPSYSVYHDVFQQYQQRQERERERGSKHTRAYFLSLLFSRNER